MLLGKNKFGEDVAIDAAGTRTVSANGVVLGSLSSPTPIDPYKTIEHRYVTVLELVEMTCREHEDELFGIVAAATVRKIAKYWESYLMDGADKEIISSDIHSIKQSLDEILQDLVKVLDLKNPSPSA